ncbi:hypothetical protein [Nocardia sp. NPDC059236]|uniref:hypothetical protein n=2 Tax=unclassified Nocardia TaxID=2637762 RepID=UPI0036CE4EB1
MARDPDNVKIWQDAHVYVSAAAVRPALPTDIDADMPVGWDEVGILNGGDGFPEDRSNSETKHSGWGIGIVKMGSKDFELTRKFSPLEDNEITQAIVNPGATATKILMPKPVYRWLGFETDSDLGDKERLFTVLRARLWVPANSRNESDITKWEVTCNVFANGASEVFDRQAGTPTP